MRPSRALLYSSAPYDLLLSWPPRAALKLTMPARWPGDAVRGAELLAGRFRFLGEIVASKVPPWDAGRGEDWRAALHGFSWLADLAALGGAEAAEAARQWCYDWVRHYRAYDRFAWRPDIIGDRLFAWLEHPDLIGASGDRDVLAASVARQARHLGRVAAQEAEGLARLKALRGLVAAWTALGGASRLARALLALERETTQQILVDGGHRARSPVAQLAALVYLIDARTALLGAGEGVPVFLDGAIARAGPMLRFFRHGDGGFALFNGADEGDRAMIDFVLARAETSARAPASAPETGFDRLQAGGTLVVVDCGAPPPPGFDRGAHAGTLAFEMSHGRERIIVNCGAQDGGAGGAWRAALAATAAHSTLVVADTNSAEIAPDGALGAGPRAVTHQHAEHAGDLWVAATHDGYQANFGLVHGRQLFLSADGSDLRGEDSLTGSAGRGFTIRFHLHPRVDAALQPDGNAVALALPGGTRWRLRAEGAVLSLAESVYAGSGSAEKTQQILLDGHVGTHGARVRWAIGREG
jgi:uncharacterized heparinase superfamily protein